MEIAIIVVALWITFSIATGIIAFSKDRSVFGFFLLSFFLSPVIGMTAAIISVPGIGVQERREDALITARKAKRCASCHELVRPEAKICRFCHQSEFALHL